MFYLWVSRFLLRMDSCKWQTWNRSLWFSLQSERMSGPTEASHCVCTESWGVVTGSAATCGKLTPPPLPLSSLWTQSTTTSVAISTSQSLLSALFPLPLSPLPHLPPPLPHPHHLPHPLTLPPPHLPQLNHHQSSHRWGYPQLLLSFPSSAGNPHSDSSSMHSHHTTVLEEEEKQGLTK